MRDWEDSAKLKHAQAIERFFAGRAAPLDYRHAIAFAQREAARINAARTARGWVAGNGNPRHPDRWTTRGLGDDARTADAFEAGLELHETYERCKGNEPRGSEPLPPISHTTQQAQIEIVLDGLSAAAINGAMRAGIQAACAPGARAITAGNYGGKLGPYHFHLRQVIKGIS